MGVTIITPPHCLVLRIKYKSASKALNIASAYAKSTDAVAFVCVAR